MNILRVLILTLLLGSMMFATTTTANANSLFAPENLCANTSICQNDGSKVQIQATELDNTVRFRIINLDSKDIIGTYIVHQDNELMRCHNGTAIQVSESETIAINKLGGGLYTLQITLNDGSVYSQEIWVQ